MDKFGRRFLLLGSSIMMIIFLTVFGTYQNYVRYDRDPDWMEYMGLVSILMFSLSFSLGEGMRTVPIKTCPYPDLSQSNIYLTHFQDLSLGWSLVKCSMPVPKGSVRPSVLH